MFVFVWGASIASRHPAEICLPRKEWILAVYGEVSGDRPRAVLCGYSSGTLKTGLRKK